MTSHHSPIAAGTPPGDANQPKRRWRARKGGIMVVVAGAMVVLLGAAAWTVDMGMLLQDRTHHQAAADAGALAGAWEIPVDPNDDEAIKEAVVQWVQANQRDRPLDVTTANVTIWDHPAGSKAVTVRWTQPRNLLFARIFGQESAGVAVQASATVGHPEGRLAGTLPFGLPGYEQDGKWYVLVNNAGTTMHPDGVTELEGTYEPLTDHMDESNPFLIKAGSGSNNGNFMALSPFGGGANAFEASIKEGIPAPGIELGEDYNTEPGNMRGPTDDGGDYRLADESRRDAVVPIIDALDWHDAAGRARPVTVIGYAGVYLMSSDSGAITAIHKPVSIGGGGDLGFDPATPGVHVPILIPTPAQ